MTSKAEEIERIVASIKGSPKYQDTSEGTIRRFTETYVGRYKTSKETEKAVRKQLHHIMAFHIGDPDYDEAATVLRTAFQSGSREAVKDACAQIMSVHLSTRERLPILDRFYREIFDVTGKPEIILDIACALNPLTFPWMRLPSTIKYFAYDIHERRIEFLNTFFSLQGLPPLAKVQDVAFHFPEERGDIALFLKELPRFERYYDEAGLNLLEALRARYLVVSFPTVSFHSGRVLTDHYREFFHELIAGKRWSMTEIEFESELVFCVDKQ